MNFYDSFEYLAPSPSVVALGCFDGIHIGHMAVIKSAKEIANKASLPLTVWCFEEPPKNFFLPCSVPLITDKNEKKQLMSEIGVDTLVCVPFFQAIADMSAKDFFCEILIKRLKASHIACGFNFTF